MAGTKPPGNDPQAVYEAIRKYGLIPEEMLPYSDDLQSVEEYYSFKGADREACLAEGRRWLEKYDFAHEWAFKQSDTADDKIKNMEISLKTSPLACAVYAWYADGEGFYIKAGPENHWTLVYALDQVGRLVEKVSDTYEPFMKDCAQEMLFCKRIYIGLKPAVPPFSTPKLSWWERFINLFKRSK